MVHKPLLRRRYFEQHRHDGSKSVSTTADAKSVTNATAKSVGRGATESVFTSTAKSRSSAAAGFCASQTNIHLATQSSKRSKTVRGTTTYLERSKPSTTSPLSLSPPSSWPAVLICSP
ncbi:hypothetical protein PI126_g21376 [Phytophthora idaei]|nr:hypothetical protein PI126_g21376 [Phytophthora idaei]